MFKNRNTIRGIHQQGYQSFDRKESLITNANFHSSSKFHKRQGKPVRYDTHNYWIFKCFVLPIVLCF